MTGLFGIRPAALLLLMISTVSLGQELKPSAAVQIVSNKIQFIPPLARAVINGDRKEVVKLINENKSENVNEKVLAKDGERAGFTPLVLAASLGTPDITRILIEHGAKVTLRDDFNRSAFWYAALRQNMSVSRILSNAPGAAEVINAPDDDLQRTPLHLAVRGSSYELVALLLKVGASESKARKDILGQTPLDYCKIHMTSACKALF